MLSRADGLKLVRNHVGNKNLVKHMIATEGVMRVLSRHFKEDEETWAIAGLLHDLDYIETADDFSRHGFRTVDILRNEDVPEDVLHAIKAHPGHVPRQTNMDKALFAVDPLTGLIVAAVLMHPDKKLLALDVKFIMRRFKEKRFAAGADRNQILACEEMGIPLEEFIAFGLQGMCEVSEELGF